MTKTAFLWRWLSEAQQRDAVASAKVAALPSDRLRASTAIQSPEEYVYVRLDVGEWIIRSGLWPFDLDGVRVALPEERDGYVEGAK